MKICSYCKGEGEFLDTTYDRTGLYVKCDTCFGTGLHKDELRLFIEETFGTPKNRVPKKREIPDFVIKTLKICARETRTDNIGDRWYTEGALKAQQTLRLIKQEN